VQEALAILKVDDISKTAASTGQKLDVEKFAPLHELKCTLAGVTRETEG